MNCFVCAENGSEIAAVALCPRCSAGLCLAHVRDEAKDQGPGGMHFACEHGTWNPV